MALVAGKGYVAKRVWGQVTDGIPDGGEIIDTLEEGGHVDGEHAGHEIGDGEEDGGHVYGESGVCEEGVELLNR